VYRTRLEKYILDNFVKELLFMFIKLHNFVRWRKRTENSEIKIKLNSWRLGALSRAMIFRAIRFVRFLDRIIILSQFCYKHVLEISSIR